MPHLRLISQISFIVRWLFTNVLLLDLKLFSLSKYFYFLSAKDASHDNVNLYIALYKEIAYYDMEN